MCQSTIYLVLNSEKLKLAVILKLAKSEPEHEFCELVKLASKMK